jgi:hypothetical protein
VVLRLGDQHLDLLVGHLLLGLAVLAKQPQQGAAGEIEQPDEGQGDFRENAHRRRHPDGYAFRVAERDLLGDKLADYQRAVGDHRHHDADAQRVGGVGGHAERQQLPGQAFAERGAGKSPGKHADQSDADLHGGQETAGIGAKRQSTAGPLHVPVDHRLEAGRTRRNHGQFGHGQQAVDADEDEDDRYFCIDHARSIASPPLQGK